MTLLVLDSASLWYRAYYGMPDSLVSPDGTPVNAIRGYMDMVARLIGQYRPSRLIAAIDGDWRPSWRVELFPEYKMNRVAQDGEEEEPDLLTPQIPILLEVIESFGIPIIGQDDFEADDVIATISKSEKGPIRIVTGDRDLFQLVDQKNDVKVVYLAKGITNHDLVDHKWIEKKYGIPGNRYALFAMIRGDASDGLPGIRGIGEKGAAEIAKNHSSAAEVIKAAQDGRDSLKISHAKKVLESIAYAEIMEKLVNCSVEVNLPKYDSKIANFACDAQKLQILGERYGIQTSIKRLSQALA